MAALRTAVRRGLRPYSTHGYRPGSRLSPAGGAGVVLVGCSGGADSLALATAALFVAPRMGLRAGLVTIDHGLQVGSAERASTVAAWAASVGFDPVLIRTVAATGRPGGPEAAARDARYEALVEAARAAGSCTVLVGHTRDDQAETVLLALVRGAGARGLAAMPAVKVIDGAPPITVLRPLLDVTRTQTHGACAALGLTPWQDPHNIDPAYTRTHARELLGVLVERLGPAVVANLARTAALAAADVEVIDGLAAAALMGASSPDGALRVEPLLSLPTAVRRAVLRGWIRRAGVPLAAVAHAHLTALDGLIADWHGQGGVGLPGGRVAGRRNDQLTISP